MTPSKALLLVNLGTPERPDTKSVRRYLSEFLMDKRVIDIPFWKRFFLVRGIIAPFRAPSSAREYKKIWDEKGSPLKYYNQSLVHKLQEALGEDYIVILAMRYQQPSIRKALQTLEKKALSELIILPLFPQYASATTGSVLEEVFEHLRHWNTIPSTHWISQFYHAKPFLHAWTAQTKAYMHKKYYEHFLFSYHGLPERHIRKAAAENVCTLDTCCHHITPENQYCYRAQCFATTKHIAQALHLQAHQYTTAFQSRLGKDPWIKPYTEDTLKELAQHSKKHVLCLAPSFVTDCLETLVEIKETYRDQFLSYGGQSFDLVPCLNDSPTWIQALLALIKHSTENLSPSHA